MERVANMDSIVLDENDISYTCTVNFHIDMWLIRTSCLSHKHDERVTITTTTDADKEYEAIGMDGFAGNLVWKPSV